MRVIRFGLALLLLVGFNQGPEAKETGALSQTALRRLEADILSSPSATQTLTIYCAELHLAEPPVIHAVRDRTLDRKAGSDIRHLLKVGAGDAVRYRRVRLSCGTRVLSDAENWYVPSRLTPDMNRRLDHTDTPFGTVVKPLDFHRRALGTEMLHDGRHVLKIRALLMTQDGLPFSLVQENYSVVLLKRR